MQPKAVWRGLRWIALGALALLLLVDLRRSPSQQLTNRILITAIRGYQAVLSKPISWTGAQCRFEPSCSRYAEVALTNRGAVAGLLATGDRLLRCGPWTPNGTVDPPPLPIDEAGRGDRLESLR